MKKILILLAFSILVACGDNGMSAEPNYEYSPQKTVSSSSVSRPVYSSSSRIVITLSSSSNFVIIQKPSSSSVSMSLEEICDMAAANVLNATNINSKEKACSDYKDYLTYIVKMTTADLNYCMKFETCNEISTSITVSKCNTTCVSKIRSNAAANGNARSSSTAKAIERECGCTCTNNNPMNCH